jgi:3-dehydroquinate synthase
VDPVFFETLPKRELLSGWAEVIKHALIGSEPLWRQVEATEDWAQVDWLLLLSRSIGVKVHVVRQDPFEKNLRMLLNFGHTIGHAIESYFLHTESPLTHGEAIAVGMVAEARLAATLNPIFQRIYDMLRVQIPRFYQPVAIPQHAGDVLWQLMLQDKKNRGGSVRMAVPRGFDYQYELMEVTKEQILSVIWQ